MKESVPMGMNRTGIQMSPFDSSTMENIPPSAIPSTPGDDSEMAAVRTNYIESADPLGSVPIPGTVTGALKTGVSMLTGSDPQIFLDKLGERLAFERTGTRLYDAVITKHASMAAGNKPSTLSEDALLEIREDELRHMSLLADAISSVGGDPTAQTPCADLVGVESIGLMQAVTDPRTTVAQSLHAILTAEMTDNAGWEMLIELAKANNQAALADEFRSALEDERRHLHLVRTWVEESVLGDAHYAMAGNSVAATGNEISSSTPP